MGSSEEGKSVTVLVTGFGTFSGLLDNPSRIIAQSLPKTILAQDGSSLAIRIMVPEPSIEVNYRTVFELIPELLTTFQHNIDMVLHIGMAPGRKFYTIEQFAHREGYTKHKDVEGNTFSEAESLRAFPDCPSKMTTSLHYPWLLSSWRARALATKNGERALAWEDLRQSVDAGSFLCDFIYFNSLAWMGRCNKAMDGTKPTDRPVIFLHVPGETDPASLDRGRTATVALIKAMAEQISTPWDSNFR